MKREIEFRAQRADNKEWVYGDLVRIPDGDSFDCYIISDFDERDSVYDLWKYAIKVIPETVGQYVGITDKNGKKVYVGDIIKANHNFYPYKVFVRECKVCIEDKYGNAIRPTTEALKHFDSEVIGTIFDKESDNGD